MAITYFNAYHSYLKSIEPLNDAECGRLFKALLEYSATGIAPELRGNERFIFPTMKEQIDRDMEKYSVKCKKNRDSINSRWNKEDTNVYERTSEDTNVYERIKNDTNYTKEKEKKKEKEKDKEKENIYSEHLALNDSILSFIEHRKKIKKPMSDEAIKLLMSKLNKLSADPLEQIEIINQSILNGWTGVFPLKQETVTSNAKNVRDTLLDWKETYH